jgi:hypothetical protein
VSSEDRRVVVGFDPAVKGATGKTSIGDTLGLALAYVTTGPDGERRVVDAAPWTQDRFTLNDHESLFAAVSRLPQVHEYEQGIRPDFEA